MLLNVQSYLTSLIFFMELKIQFEPLNYWDKLWGNMFYRSLDLWKDCFQKISYVGFYQFRLEGVCKAGHEHVNL